MQGLLRTGFLACGQLLSSCVLTWPFFQACLWVGRGGGEEETPGESRLYVSSNYFKGINPIMSTLPHDLI